MKNNRWATVAVGLNGNHHVCVKLRKGETATDVERRVEDSLWGAPAKVIRIFPDPWGK